MEEHKDLYFHIGSEFSSYVDGGESKEGKNKEIAATVHNDNSSRVQRL